MKVMKLSVFVFVILAVVFVSCWGGDTDEEALMLPNPSFQKFLFALTWPNQYCATKNCNPSVPTQQQYFTIHGLWPQNTPDFSENGCHTNINFNPDKLRRTMKTKLNKYWPNLKDADASANFWEFQWKKHGTCSSNMYKPEEYFQKCINLAERYSASIYKALINKGVIPNGSQYRERDILSAVREVTGFVPLLGYANQGRALAEIHLCVEDDAVRLYDCERQLKFADRPSISPSPSPSPSLSLSQSQSRFIRWWVSSIFEAVDNVV